MINLKPIQGQNLSQHSGLWAVEPARFLTLFENLRRENLVIQAGSLDEGLQAQAITETSKADGDITIGLINLTGVLTKDLGWFSNSTIEVRRQIREAARREDIDGIILRIDSPGGSVAGVADLAKEVSDANKIKPVFAFVEDLGASAAYWVASQAEKVFANDTTALIGSIGTFIGFYDLSGLAEKEGIKPIVIKSGKFKGAAFPGVEVTEEFQEELQNLVDKTQAEFNRAISKGRALTAKEVKELADGRVHMARDAAKLGLIDGIQSLDRTVADLSALCKKQRRGMAAAQSKETAMAFKEEGNDSGAGVQTGVEATVQVEIRTPATAEEIEKECTGADASFILDQVKRKATVAEAMHAWIQLQGKRLEEEQKAKKDAEEKVAAAEEEIPGVDGVGEEARGSATTVGDVELQWKEAVEAKVKLGLDRQRAVSAVAKEQPGLREAYVEAANAGRK